ncbi:hypothetical protein SAMN05216410_1514 [Sanguibacter gelidistatuariae]|uniref:Uncharacterized protein n=1 Tax=Sanguibacter gelidistatuariae TaxID=1814289 RepID=A0A1G6K6W9_9MICO|nr:hypothetical protein [Sanguibacter gelidistatuariae]SDC26591.1 hypothetical protein SAMN05216410_1514 [Sanguibacter gelidistatuariae]
MAAYLAHITVRDDLDDDQVTGMADALGAFGDPEVHVDRIVFVVPGEAPDSTTAEIAASQHAAELLDGYMYEVEVTEVR